MSYLFLLSVWLHPRKPNRPQSAPVPRLLSMARPPLLVYRSNRVKLALAQSSPYPNALVFFPVPDQHPPIWPLPVPPQPHNSFHPPSSRNVPRPSQMTPMLESLASGTRPFGPSCSCLPAVPPLVPPSRQAASLPGQDSPVATCSHRRTLPEAARKTRRVMEALTSRAACSRAQVRSSRTG